MITNGELLQVLKMMVGSKLKDSKLQRIVNMTILFAIVGGKDCLINAFLQLSVFQVGTNHHFQHLEELTIADVPVVVNVVASGKFEDMNYMLEVE